MVACVARVRVAAAAALGSKGGCEARGKTFYRLCQPRDARTGEIGQWRCSSA
jgi:hypothetical protein